MSNGVAPRSRAFASTSFAGTKMNLACGSMNFLISQGHATRSTLTFFTVIHFRRLMTDDQTERHSKASRFDPDVPPSHCCAGIRLHTDETGRTTALEVGIFEEGGLLTHLGFGVCKKDRVVIAL